MSPERELVEKLTTLNHIAERLNRAVDVRGVLQHTLADLVELMGLETGWITLIDPPGGGENATSGHVLAAHHNLPPALAPDNREAWAGSCTCLDRCRAGRLDEAYNQVRCSRLNRESRDGGDLDRRGLAVHASAPLRSGDRVLGVLNVAAPDWSAFRPETLSLLTNVGSQMGVALERARLFDLLQERHQNQETALLYFSSQLLGRMDLDDLMDFLVKSVQEILHADACALLLPDEQPGSLRFRAASGWRTNPAAAGWSLSTNGSSGPGRVMQSRQPLLVEDIQAQDATSWMPVWLQAEEFRGYAVMPLLTNGRASGALVVNQRQPWLLPQDDLHCLHLMANQAAFAIEKARLLEEEARMQVLEKEMAIGRQIQLSLLPAAPPTVPGWEFAAYYQAAREVGGDFYDFFGLPSESGRWGLVIADVTGKGVPAALFMARNLTLIRSAGLYAGSPAMALKQVNDLLCQGEPSRLLLTALHAVLDARSGRLVLANGGHCRPLLLRAGTGQIEEVVSEGLLLGMFPGAPIKEREITVEPGDLLVFYTDGVTEAMNDSREIFDEARLWATVRAEAGAGAQEVADAIVQAVHAFRGTAAPQDDLTLVVLRRSPKA